MGCLNIITGLLVVGILLPVGGYTHGLMLEYYNLFNALYKVC